MATATTPSPTTAPPDAPSAPLAFEPYRLTVAQFATMIGAGVFPDEARIELLGGVLSEKMTKYPPHTFTVDELEELLRGVMPDGWIIRKEHPIVLADDWQPEPDLAVVVGPRSRYRAAHPQATDVAMLIEVSDSTYSLDRRVKSRGYAAAKVPCYWIVNLDARKVEVYTDPDGSEYRTAKTYGPEDEIPVVVDGRVVGAIRVGDILP